MSNDQHQTHNYRPRSPNLSGFEAPPPPRLSRLPSISATQIDSGFPQGYSFQHRGSYDASPYFSPSGSNQTSYFSAPTYQSPQTGQPVAQPYFSDVRLFQPVQDDMARLRGRPQVNYNEDTHPVNEFDERIAHREHALPEPQPNFAQGPPPDMYPQFPQTQSFAPMPQPTLPVIQPSLLPHIDVRTKFPVARIKRIMQTDEDIGKVAQATPTAVAKALELFMIALVSKGAHTAKDQHSKRVTATHLKTALLADPQFDFLNEICESVADEGTKKSRGKSEAKSESDDEDIAGVGAPKKRKGGKRKKPAGDDSD